MRIAGKIAIGLAVFCLALLGVVFAINLFDEDLTAESSALLAPPLNPYADEDNLYIAMAGFEAPSQQSVVKVGKARVEDYNKSLDAALLDPDAAMALIRKSDPDKLKFDGDVKAWQPVTSSIWEVAKSRREEISRLLVANPELYQRYLALSALKGYHETARPSHLTPLVYVPQQVRALFLANAAARLQTGSLAEQREVLRDLRQDLQLWRRMLAGDGALVSKMLAIVWLHGDLLLLADLVADPKADLTALGDELDATIAPFDLDDWKIANTFGAELRFSASVFKTIPLANSPFAGSSARPASWWERQWNVSVVQFFKLNATLNDSAHHMSRLAALAEADPAYFSAEQRSYHQRLERESALSLRFLYNPVGKMLTRIAGPVYDDYILRAYDVAAFQRLVNLIYQSRRLQLDAAGITALMGQHPEWSTHPVDGTPFLWKPETGELRVDTKATQRAERRFGVQVSLQR